MMESAMGGRGRQSARYQVGIVAVSVWLSASAAAFAQADGCKLTPDDRNPPEKILRCGDDLTIRAAKGTRYRLTDQKENELPKGAQLDAGALMIEFQPSERLKAFQILTPHAIAAVRGTKWAVEVSSEKTSTLVISGAVEVGRPGAKQTVVLDPGEGADVSPRSGPIVVKRWAKKRVRALLARFGR